MLIYLRCLSVSVAPIVVTVSTESSLAVPGVYVCGVTLLSLSVFLRTVALRQLHQGKSRHHFCRGIHSHVPTSRSRSYQSVSMLFSPSCESVCCIFLFSPSCVFVCCIFLFSPTPKCVHVAYSTSCLTPHASLPIFFIRLWFCLLAFSLASFAEQKLLILMKSS